MIRATQNADTVNSILDNLESVLNANTDLQWEFKAFFNPDSIAQAKFPFGWINFMDEDFEFNHNQKSKYNQVIVNLITGFQESSDRLLTRQRINLNHNVRDNVTVPSLNVGDLVTSKLVSRVEYDDIVVQDNDNNVSLMTMQIRIKYREL
jgi:hypothetical protein